LEIDRRGRYKKELVKKDVKLTTAEGKNEWSLPLLLLYAFVARTRET
jgi:hypothetical protein